MAKYLYSGPVMLFDKCIEGKWKGETHATSESKAKSNLTYRYKKEAGLISNSRITLPGKIELVNPYLES